MLTSYVNLITITIIKALCELVLFTLPQLQNLLVTEFSKGTLFCIDCLRLINICAFLLELGVVVGWPSVNCTVVILARWLLILIFWLLVIYKCPCIFELFTSNTIDAFILDLAKVNVIDASSSITIWWYLVLQRKLPICQAFVWTCELKLLVSKVFLLRWISFHVEIMKACHNVLLNLLVC